MDAIPDAIHGNAKGGSERKAHAERLSKVFQRLELGATRVAEAETAYMSAREASVVASWKFCTLHVPAVCCSLKSADHARVEELQRLQWIVLDALSKVPDRLANAVESVTMSAAKRNGERWLEAIL